MLDPSKVTIAFFNYSAMSDLVIFFYKHKFLFVSFGWDMTVYLGECWVAINYILDYRFGSVCDRYIIMNWCK